MATVHISQIFMLLKIWKPINLLNSELFGAGRTMLQLERYPCLCNYTKVENFVSSYVVMPIMQYIACNMDDL